ncbi:hypothetical protein K438DRAFT_1964850 [Mycena galopus ATCC 62051]|nr:hypothetical protein K438DRAFT_1964850 [Mycena galopus ATCC 62051]
MILALGSSLPPALAALANGNATALYDPIPVPTFECQTSPPPFHLNDFESYTAIACGDPVSVNDTVTQLEEYLNAAKVSQFSDLTNADDVLSRSDKKYTVQAGLRLCMVSAINTSNPLLLFGNTLDPATAASGNALKTSEAFPGSVVLTQDSTGGYFRAYFVNGTLPASGTVCPVDAELFPSASGNATSKRGLSSVEELLHAGREISSVMRRVVPRGAL